MKNDYQSVQNVPFFFTEVSKEECQVRVGWFINNEP